MVFQIKVVSWVDLINSYKLRRHHDMNVYFGAICQFFNVMCRCHIENYMFLKGADIIEIYSGIKSASVSLMRYQKVYICPKCFETQTGLFAKNTSMLLEVPYLIFRLVDVPLRCEKHQKNTIVNILDVSLNKTYYFSDCDVQCIKCTFHHNSNIYMRYRNIGFIQASRYHISLSDDDVKNFLPKRKYKKLMTIRSLLYTSLPNDIAHIAYEYYF